MPQVEVQSRVIGRPREEVPTILVEAVEGRITAAELIRRTVIEQIRQMELRRRMDAEEIRRALRRQYLTDEEIAAQAETGRVRVPTAEPEERAAVDADAEARKALRAFETRRFSIFCGGRQIERLDEELAFQEQVKVTFVRLVPLEGG